MKLCGNKDIAYDSERLKGVCSVRSDLATLIEVLFYYIVNNF